MNLSPLQKLIKSSPLERLAPFLEEDYLQQITHGDFPKWRQRLSELPQIKPSAVSLGDTISIGTSEDSDPAIIESLQGQLREFIPWRKGPFNLFGTHIDTEWQSQIKWNRLRREISSLKDRKVLDVGCGNGYSGFRMLESGAELVLGIDPHIAYVAQFWLLKHFIPELPIFVLPLTLEQMPSPMRHFDTVFSMGVIYHRRSPIDHLLQLKNCCRPGGEVILESIYVDGEEGYCLTPIKKYARMSNVWFLPSIKTLMQWMRRCGFIDIRVIDESVTTAEEQRKTEWMPFDSLESALNPEDPKLTIEGLPAPKRIVVSATCP